MWLRGSVDTWARDWTVPSREVAQCRVEAVKRGVVDAVCTVGIHLLGGGVAGVVGREGVAGNKGRHKQMFAGDSG